MNAETETLTFKQVVKVPPSQVYYAFTTATGFREWLCKLADVEPRKKGRLYFWWESGYYASGHYTALEKNKSLSFVWQGKDEPHPTMVSVTLREQGEGTLVTLEHLAIGKGAEWEQATQQIEKGWQTALENLQTVLETGFDQRLYRRPMLGILVSKLITPEIAAKHNLPVDYGIQLSDVVSGMGAEAVGLRADDILVEMQGHKLKDFGSLSQVTDQHFAGDRVSLAFYRGQQKHNVQMALSGRHKPEIPETGPALAEKLEKVYKKVNKQVTVLFQDVAEEQAGHKPEPAEWSAKETLAHLIAHERFNADWIVSLLNNYETQTYTANNHLMVASIVGVYPTVKELMQELERTEKQVLALLTELPAEFVARKSSYVRLAAGILEDTTYHAEGHLKQIEEAIRVAQA